MINLTVRQLIIISALAKGVNRKEICRIAECSNTNVNRTMESAEYQKIFNDFLEIYAEYGETNNLNNYRGLETIIESIRIRLIWMKYN